MQKIALPVIFVSAVAAALFYVSQEEHGTGTLCLLSAVLLVGQICATLPFILEAKRPKAGTPTNTGSDGNAQKILANQQIIHEDLRSLGETLIKRLNVISEHRDSAEKKLLAAFPKNDSRRTEDLEELLGKISRNLDERFEALNEKVEEIGKTESGEIARKKLDAIEARLEDFLTALGNLSAETQGGSGNFDAGDDEDDAFTDFDELEEDGDSESEVPSPRASNIVEDFPEEPATQGEFELGDMPPVHGAELVLDAMLGIENKPFLRGNAPGLSENAGTPMTFVEIGKWSYDFGELTEKISVRILRNDDESAPIGDPVTLAPGQKLELAYEPERA